MQPGHTPKPQVAPASALRLEGCGVNGQGPPVAIRRRPPDRGIPLEAALAEQAHDLAMPFPNMRFTLAMYDDSTAPNALAFPAGVLDEGMSSIALGHNLMIAASDVYEDQKVVSFGAPIAVLAHELGHVAQYMYGIRGPTPQMELMADAIAGFLFANNITQDQVLSRDEQQLIREGARRIFLMGDFAFTDAQHHGTPDQRLHAFSFGVSLRIERGLGDKDLDTVMQVTRQRFVPVR